MMANYEIKRTPEVTLRSDHYWRPAPLISALGIQTRTFRVPQELVLVSDDLGNAVAGKALRRYLLDLEEERKVSILVSVHQWTPGAETELNTILSQSRFETICEANARLMFRPNYGGDVYNFRAEVMVPPTLAPGTGFTGITIDGSVRHALNPPIVKLRGYVLRYNQNQFSKSF